MAPVVPASRPRGVLPRKHRVGRVLLPGPYPSGWSRFVRLEGVLPLVHCALHLPVSLARPESSDGADPSRRCQGCSRPTPRFQCRTALSFHDQLHQVMGGLLHPTRLRDASWRRLSSSKTIQACFRRASFYLGPLLPNPARDRLLVALGRSPGRLLPAPAQLPQDLPHVADVVPHPGRDRDHHCHPLQRPELGLPAVRARPFEQSPLDVFQLLRRQSGRAPRPLRLSQAPDTLLLPGMVPGGGTLPRHSQLACHLCRSHALREQPGSTQPPLLQGAAIPTTPSHPARAPDGTCARTWAHGRAILASRASVRLLREDL
jgi:hypothetical protein